MILGDFGAKIIMRAFLVEFVEKTANVWQGSLNMKNEFDLLDVLFVIETLIAGYFIYYLWGTVL